MIFIFDVDGTLTPSRAKIDEHFERWFTYWVKFQQSSGNQVWIISGSDLPKTLEQMGQPLVDLVDRCYNCMGNTLYIKGEMVYERKFEMPTALTDYLNNAVSTGKWPHRYPPHIEHRPGMVNFSVVGRGSVGKQRTDYYEWDLVHGERAQITKDINTMFESDNISAHVGGETGVDISYTGSDKGQIISDINEPAVFFGDKLSPGGNDYPLKVALSKHSHFNHVCKPVTDYSDTLKKLQSFYL